MFSLNFLLKSLGFALLLSLLGPIGCIERKELGSPKNPIKLSLVPGQDAGVLLENGKVLADFLEKETHLSFQIFVPTSFIAVVETFGTKRTAFRRQKPFPAMILYAPHICAVRGS